MAIILEAAYSKKLGLPNYSSHSYVVSIRTELSDLTQVEAESARLYALLQRSVDGEIQEVGFLPDATTYGMNGHQAGAHRNGEDTTHPNGNSEGEERRRDRPLDPDRPADVWVCSDKQKELDPQTGRAAQAGQAGGRSPGEGNVRSAGQDLQPHAGQRADRGTARTPWQKRPTAWRQSRGNGAASNAAINPPGHEHARGYLAAATRRDQIIAKLQQKVSASKLTLFQSCRLKFFFRYVLGLRKPKTAALHVGVAVHAVLSNWNRARWRQQSPDLAELHASYQEVWQKHADRRTRGVGQPRRGSRTAADRLETPGDVLS